MHLTYKQVEKLYRSMDNTDAVYIETTEADPYTQGEAVAHVYTTIVVVVYPAERGRGGSDERILPNGEVAVSLRA